MALGLTQPLTEMSKQTNKLHGLSPRANYTDRATTATEMSTRNFSEGVGGGGVARKPDKNTAICEPIVWKMWDL
jgi:hypothetical protein